MRKTRPVTAKLFCDAFQSSYKEVRKSFSTEQWEDAWWGRPWGDLILSRPDETACLPKGAKRSLLSGVARRLGLRYPSELGNRQPMTFDAAFSANYSNNDPFPLRVVIENEAEWRRFECEIRKLLSVRCPLKVGITYTDSARGGSQHRDEIASWIHEDFKEIQLVIGEDARTEYLFLVGESESLEISWYSLQFQARNGPQKRAFEPVG
jgi:hypothetical protein